MLAAVAMASNVEADTTFCEKRNNNTTAKLLECVTLDGVREHQAALQEIANANGGNRFSGLPGSDASINYVVERLEAAGYHPVEQCRPRHSTTSRSRRGRFVCIGICIFFRLPPGVRVNAARFSFYVHRTTLGAKHAPTPLSC